MSDELTTKLTEALRRCKRLIPVSSDEWAEADWVLERYEAAKAQPVQDLTTKLAEALRNMVELAEYWFNREDRRGFSADQYRTWHALGFGSNTVLNAREALRLFDAAKAEPVQESSICDSLPPLPEPHWVEEVSLGTLVYTADQMHAYARAGYIAGLEAAASAIEPHVWLYDFMDGTTTVRNWSTTNKAEAFAPGNFNQRGYVPVEN